MHLTISDIRDGMEIVGLLGGVAALLILWWLRDKFVPKAIYDQARQVDQAAVEEISRLVDSHERALAKLEADLAHVPSRNDLDKLSDKIAAVGGDVKALRQAVEGIGEQLAMLLEQHLKGAAGRNR